MQGFRRRRRSMLTLVLCIALVTAGSALALQRPGRTIVRKVAP